MYYVVQQFMRKRTKSGQSRITRLPWSSKDMFSDVKKAERRQEKLAKDGVSSEILIVTVSSYRKVEA